MTENDFIEKLEELAETVREEIPEVAVCLYALMGSIQGGRLYEYAKISRKFSVRSIEELRNVNLTVN